MYCRRRWPGVGAMKAIMAEWDLSEWEARTLYEATSSQATQDKVLDRGGFGLGLIILEMRLQTKLFDYVETERARLKNEQERAAANDRRLGEVVRHLRAVPNLGAD
jgi:hypothetical protein